MSTDKLTLQRILQLGYAAYEHSYLLPDYICRAVWALLTCRTAVLGRPCKRALMAMRSPLGPPVAARAQSFPGVGRSERLVAGDPQEAIHVVHDAGVSGKE